MSRYHALIIGPTGREYDHGLHATIRDANKALDEKDWGICARYVCDTKNPERGDVSNADDGRDFVCPTCRSAIYVPEGNNAVACCGVIHDVEAYGDIEQEVTCR